jgi:rfaE bifunctional protein kinase chain/domain
LHLRLSGFRGRRAVVVGEVIEDRYVFCDPPGVAGESPVLALRPVHERSFDGGAAVVARHLAALGAEPTLVTALPRDPAVVDALRERLAGEGVNLAFVSQETPVASKHRFIVGHEKVVKVDWVRQAVLDAKEQDRLVALAGEHAEGCDAAIVTDFGLGLFSGVLLERLTAALRPRARVLTGDVSGHRNHLRAMRRMDLVTPSESELRASARMYDESLPAVAWNHLEATGSRAMIVTMGAEGLVTFEPFESEKQVNKRAEASDQAYRSRLKSEHVPALSAHVVDALGCGDALLAGATLTMACGGSLLEGAFVGALAASVHGSRMGNVPVDMATLRRRVETVGGSALSFVPADVLAARVVPRVTHLAS